MISVLVGLAPGEENHVSRHIYDGLGEVNTGLYEPEGGAMID